MLKKAEQNLEAAERVVGTSTGPAVERAEVRTKIAHGWIQLARELRA
jgi:hypothetical protein